MPELNKEKILVMAFDVATRFDLSALRSQTLSWGKELERNPLIVEFPEKRYLAIFEYGSVVFINFPDEEIKPKLVNLKTHAVGANRREFSDNFTLYLGEQGAATTEELYVRELTTDVVKLVAIVLSRSVSLEYYEDLCVQILAGLEKPVEKLTGEGRFSLKPRDYQKQVGLVLAIDLELAYNLQLLDEPDVVWESSNMQRIYESLGEIFSLKERAHVIEHKLKIIKESNEFMLSQLQHRSAKYRDLAIIGLFIIETLVLIIVSLPWFQGLMR